MTISKLRILFGGAVVGLVGLLSTTAAVAAAYGQEDETAAVEETAARSPNCEQSAAQRDADRGRIVYVGPRHNVKKRIGDDKAEKEAGQPCLASSDVETRTVYVGPRRNVRMEFVRTKPKND